MSKPFKTRGVADMSVLKWTSRVALVLTTALSVWRLWKTWQLRNEPDLPVLVSAPES